MKKILVVEDEEDLLQIYSTILREGNYQVETVENGKDALNHLEKNNYDLVILDIKLPDIMGDEIVKTMRKKKIDIPIIIVTGYPSLSRSIDTLDLGIHEILIKPLTANELLRVTAEAMTM